MTGTARLRLATAVAAACVAVAACSSSTESTATGGDQAATGTSAGVLPAPSGAGTATGSSPAATSPPAGGSPTARTPVPTPRAGGAPLKTPVPAATTVGAAPGAYPVHMSVSSSLGSPFDGGGTLTVAPAAADGTQDQTLTAQGRSEGATTTYRYLTGGEVTIVAIGAGAGAPPGCGSARFTFSPPLEAVPPRPAAGVTWSGSVGGSGLTGTYTGQVVGAATDSVGGVSVAVWRLHGSVSLSGTVCGYGVTGTVTLDSDWAPALRLPVTMTTGSDVTAGLLLRLRSTTSSQLLRTTPG
ncbi:MAG TPA: hypothetical protein VFO60_08250 [Candidatus Dormibacteraeota bacterium]|nr:hypothetical protein [Candidatus Dormibacteraeota bacterium]